jgi:poly(3-hydroxybutyrate) depolymerase
MLYQIYETQRALMAPFSEFASASAKLYDHPLSPFAHMPMAAARVGQLRPAAPAGQGIREAAVRHHAATVDGVEVAVQEQVAMNKPFCRLLRFKRFTDNPARWTA